MASLFGRKVVAYKLNNSGGGVIAGDVVVPDTSADNAFTTTTSAALTTGAWVADETIASGATGRVVIDGHVTLINVTASVTRGHTGTTSTTVKKAVSTGGTTRTVGTFCKFTTGGTTPEADIWPVDLGSGSGTGTVTTVKDEGSTTSSAVVSIDFVGAQVAVTGTTAAVVTVSPPVVTETLASGSTTMTNANQLYTGVTVTPAAGTYMFIGKILVTQVSTSTDAITAVLDYNGTVYDDAFVDIGYTSGGGLQNTLTVMAKITVSGSAAVSVQAAAARAGASIVRDARSNGGAVHKSTKIEYWPCT